MDKDKWKSISLELKQVFDSFGKEALKRNLIRFVWQFGLATDHSE